MPVNDTEKHPVYAADPADVINTVASKITELPEDKWPDSVKELVPQLKKYQELLMDYTQAKILQGLGRGKLSKLFLLFCVILDFNKSFQM